MIYEVKFRVANVINFVVNEEIPLAVGERENACPRQGPPANDFKLKNICCKENEVK